jgi:paraquat-inducible protein B
MAEVNKAQVSEKKRTSPVWIVPAVALLIGLWMLVDAYRSQGPLVEIQFPTASGIEPGKTKVKVLDVEVGEVSSVTLGEDLKSVVATARLDKEAEPLLREDTQFWVVTARFGVQGISGISTILSGGYIQLAPGEAPGERRAFVGLPEPPVTPAGTPGLKIELVGDEAGSIVAGDPVLHKGYPVGRIESAKLDVGTETMRYAVFIEAEYESLVTSATRFWNASGFTFNATADGIQLEAGSMMTLLMGGVSFGEPAGMRPGQSVTDGMSFKLYPDYPSVNRAPHREVVEYVLRFEQSIRGLSEGASVEYRGIPVGRVEDILIEDVSMAGAGEPIPVLITLQPGRLFLSDDAAGVAQLRKAVSNSVTLGMRASLATGSLLTGKKYVSLDMRSHVPRQSEGTYKGRPTIPTLTSGLDGLEVQVSELLQKINEMPLEEFVVSATSLLDDVGGLMGDPAVKQLPASLAGTLAALEQTLGSLSSDSALQEQLQITLEELGRSLVSVRLLADTLNEQPNSLLFTQERRPDPVPPEGSR